MSPTSYQTAPPRESIISAVRGVGNDYSYGSSRGVRTAAALC